MDLLFLKARPLTAMDTLSAREREIARLVAEGRTYLGATASAGRTNE